MGNLSPKHFQLSKSARSCRVGKCHQEIYFDFLIFATWLLNNLLHYIFCLFFFLDLFEVTVPSDHPIQFFTLCFLTTLRTLYMSCLVVWSATSSNRGLFRFFWIPYIWSLVFTTTCKPVDTTSFWKYMKLYAVDGLLELFNTGWDYDILFRQLLISFQAVSGCFLSRTILLHKIFCVTQALVGGTMQVDCRWVPTARVYLALWSQLQYLYFKMLR